MQSTPKGFRMHIAIFGRRNTGKSSLLNLLTNQEVSIVSEVKGTTTDPVEKTMELKPLGPVVFIDTAGIDDEGELGEKRIGKTKRIIDRTDIALLVTEPNEWGDYEESLVKIFKERKIPFLTVINKIDLNHSGKTQEILKQNKYPFAAVSALKKSGLIQLKEKLFSLIPDEYVSTPDILGDIVGASETAVLVVPIDKEAPQGRLILPQVQTIRNLLDNDAVALVVKERELKSALDNLKMKPRIVITDSQAFLKVAGDTPNDVLLTSFSILFARLKGDLSEMAWGAKAVDRLKNGSRILIAEACAHHPIGEDIGRVKIPRWLLQYTGKDLKFENMQGHELPEDISKYDLVIHCGACMWNRKEMLSRIFICKQAGVPITNYGLSIAFSLGIMERALKPFPAALSRFLEE